MGAHTGLSDVGAVMMTECMTIAGWIADSVSIPVIIDSGTGHGRTMAVRRMVRESSVPASPRCASTTGPKHACDADRKGECRIAAQPLCVAAPGAAAPIWVISSRCAIRWEGRDCFARGLIKRTPSEKCDGL